MEYNKKTQWAVKIFMTLLRYSLLVLLVSIKTLITRGNGKKNRDYFSSIFNEYGQKTIKLCNLKIVVTEQEELQYHTDQSYIIISNHINHFDIPILVYVFEGNLRFFVKTEMLKIPFWGQAMNKAEFIFINRENRSEANISLKNAEKKLKDGIRLLIYPEGTRSKDGKLQPFKKGAFHLAKQINAKIIPVALVGLKPNEIPQNKTIRVNIGAMIDAAKFKDVNELKDHAWQAINNLNQ